MAGAIEYSEKQKFRVVNEIRSRHVKAPAFERGVEWHSAR